MDFKRLLLAVCILMVFFRKMAQYTLLKGGIDNSTTVNAHSDGNGGLTDDV